MIINSNNATITVIIRIHYRTKLELNSNKKILHTPKTLIAVYINCNNVTKVLILMCKTVKLYSIPA